MTVPQRLLKPEDVLAVKHVGDVQLSPDGALVAWVVGEPYRPYRGYTRRQIWLAPTSGGLARPFTGGLYTDDTPRWSPDGRTLAFLSDRHAPGRPQVYLISRDGGEARRLTDLPGTIRDLAWSSDGAQLAFLFDDPEPDDQRQRRESGDDAQEYERRHRWRRVWAVDCASGVARQVTTGDTQVWEFAWAPDGSMALLIGPEPYEWSWFLARLAWVGPQGGAPQLLQGAPEKQFACLRVSPDGTQLAFLSCTWSDRGMNGGDVLVMPVQGGLPRNLTKGYAGNVWWIAWTPDGSALDYMAYEEGQAALGRIEYATGQRVARWRDAVTVEEDFGAHYLSPDGRLIAVVRSSPSAPSDIWLAEDGQHGLLWRQLTDLHPQTRALTLGQTRTLHWQAPDGLQIQGLLMLPVGYQPGQRVPLITWVHGGPAWLYTHNYQGGGRGLQLFAAVGYAVFMPNPRGSIGWGVDFTEANLGDFGGRDFLDIMAGVDHLIDLGVADPDRLAIGGWSYGGYMAAWAVTQTNRFKAAMAGAAITNWRSFHGVASIAAWDAIGLRERPYLQGGRFDQRAPISYVERVSTPTLLIHGEQDQIVPPGQSYEFFRALKDHGIHTELVLYPREGHSFCEQAHALDRLCRYVDWFQRYLG